MPSCLGAGVAGESGVVEVLGGLGVVSPGSDEGASIGCAMPGLRRQDGQLSPRGCTGKQKRQSSVRRGDVQFGLGVDAWHFFGTRHYGPWVEFFCQTAWAACQCLFRSTFFWSPWS